MKILPFKIPKTSQQSFWIQTDYEKHFYNYLHQHSEAQITVILESEGKLIAGDYIGNFCPGDIYLLGSQLPHVFINDPEYFEEKSLKMAHSKSIFLEWKIFPLNFMQLIEMKGISELTKTSERGILYQSKNNPHLKKLIEEIFSTSPESRFFVLLNLLNELAMVKDYTLLAIDGAARTYSEEDGKRLDSIYRFTMKEFNRKITLEEVAEISNFTVNSFCRYFKKRTRKSYFGFLTEVRINQACKLLQQSELAISSICENTGFNNLSNFNRKFKEQKGVSPSTYRNSHVKLFSNNSPDVK
jgi:AraC-like DNA-binding protein